jgi:centractin
MINALE